MDIVNCEICEKPILRNEVGHVHHDKLMKKNHYFHLTCWLEEKVRKEQADRDKYCGGKFP